MSGVALVVCMADDNYVVISQYGNVYTCGDIYQAYKFIIGECIAAWRKLYDSLLTILKSHSMSIGVE